MCKASKFNLSYESLTSFKAGQALCNLPVSEPKFYAELVGQQSQHPAPTLSAKEAKSKDVEENNLDVFRDDSRVPLTEVMRAQEEPTIATGDDITGTNDCDYVLDDGGSLVSNADAEMTFVECVNNITVDVTPQGHGQQKKRRNVLYSSNMWTDNLGYDSDAQSTHIYVIGQQKKMEFYLPKKKDL